MSTKNRAVLSTEIVPEVLIKKKNYKEWSFRLRTYLKAQDVWDIIEPTSNGDVDDKVWEKKNATALHAIHICCGPDAFSLIEGIPEAKGAWDKLAESEPEREPELETEDRDISTDQVKRLYLAVREGDWCTTNWIITTYRDAVGARITYSRRTALHVAIMARKLSIVKLLVQNMSKEDLEKTDDDGFTALAIAIISNAELDIAECMVRKNTQILVTKVNEMLPAAMAFRYGHKEMGRYLYTMTPVDHLQQNREDGASIICNAIRMQSFDVALDLLHQHNELATTCESTILSRPPPVVALANLPSAFLSGCQLKFWQRWLYKCICIDSTSAILAKLKNLHINKHESMMGSGKNLPPKVRSKFGRLSLYLLKILGIKDIYDMKLGHIQTLELLRHTSNRIESMDLNDSEKEYVKDALFVAVDRGNEEFVRSTVKANPELVEELDESKRNIFMHAIKFRQPKVFSFIYNVHSKLSAATALDKEENSMLHLAANLDPNPQLNGIPGAALQMQRELQWFQEVKSIVPAWAQDHRNKEGKTPGEIFTRDHKDLVNEGEKWMKETATSCTVVGALIITMMFAAAFTVPGGNNGDSGFPIFLNKKLFMIFIISDSLSLFSSTTSVLMFLGILSSRYAEQDFLRSLPRRMMIGLFTLFFSIASMMVAFCATLFIVLRERYSWIFIPVICLASIPVTLYLFLQFPLLVDIFCYTYGGGIFDKKAKIFGVKHDRKSVRFGHRR